MTLAEVMSMAEGSQLSLAPKQKPSETRAWEILLEGTRNKSKMDAITPQDPKLQQNLLGQWQSRHS